MSGGFFDGVPMVPPRATASAAAALIKCEDDDDDDQYSDISGPSSPFGGLQGRKMRRIEGVGSPSQQPPPGQEVSERLSCTHDVLKSVTLQVPLPIEQATTTLAPPPPPPIATDLTDMIPKWDVDCRRNNVYIASIMSPPF